MRMACALAAASAALACGAFASGCAQEAVDPILNTDDTSGGVAATVNGVQIGENSVTAYIENFRDANGLTEDDDWGEWMINSSYSFESLRSAALDYFIDRELMLQAADQLGVSVSDEEIQQGVETARARFESDEDWQKALSSNGLNDDIYRDQVKMTLLRSTLIDTLGAESTATDDEVLQYVQANATSYDGSKRSSHILFSADDEATAQEVLDKINAGELDFADAAREYSIDEASAENGGDVGWDAASTFVDAYQTALDELGVGEVSGLVTSEYGIHIIMCTDQFTAPETIDSLDDVSEGFVETMREQADYAARISAFNEFMVSFEDSADIERSGLPDDAPYVLDLTSYEEAANAENAAAESDGSTDADAA